VSFQLRGHERRLPPHVEFHLLRVAQEATTNALKHAAAEHLTLTLEFTADEARLAIADDGCGFDPAAADASRFGLRGMRERSKKVAGIFTVTSQPGAGTTITMTISTTATKAPREPSAELLHSA
jgi:signal transduction histidine kinase